MNPNMLAGVEVPVNNFTKRAQKRNAANQNLQGNLGEKIIAKQSPYNFFKEIFQIFPKPTY